MDTPLSVCVSVRACVRACSVLRVCVHPLLQEGLWQQPLNLSWLQLLWALVSTIERLRAVLGGHSNDSYDTGL